MGQGQGSSLLGGILGAGGSIASSAPPPPDIVGPQQPGMMDKLMGILKDPEVIKALGKTASSLGSTISAADAIPPHAQEMFAQVVAQQQAAQQPQQTPEEMGVLTPQMAKTILEQMGIPGGFTPMVGR